MTSPYKEMWERLDLDLEAHDALLDVLGKFYGDIYLSQQGRLRGAEYLDFVLSEVHGLRIKEIQDAKAQGRKVVGTFCVFVPEEITLAADAVQVGLCAGAEAGKELAETMVPRNTCSLIKSFIGFKLARLCPYTESCDLIVGETTCDGKKKAYEPFGELVNMHVMEVPQQKNAADRALWKAEVLRYKEEIEKLTGVTITAERLATAIRTVNDKRRALQRLTALRAASPAPISGRDALLVNQISFYDDPVRFTAKMNELCDELEARVARGEGVAEAGTPRLLLSGCPMAVPNWKLPYIVESSGAVIVGEESCIGTRNSRDLVDESGATLDEMLDAIADRYMKIDCACFTPNTERQENVMDLAKTLNADGVIQYNLLFCQPYANESIRLDKTLAAEGIPSLSIETDYSMEDVQQLKTRVEAFVETLD
ncbi:double-cubane-cluster-containing anaerobic reductase [Paucidesulfovibrio longus]|uniref:double-cubane-cluster-containing anaerobic reductase n=1 Tax=Paucidesulfovibrio longus TaxID=889 RepID=UPI000412C11B|nr:double-cubane-cluster-containing anaerobic reductase [Paucidesulfovibrio longus]